MKSLMARNNISLQINTCRMGLFASNKDLHLSFALRTGGMQTWVSSHLISVLYNQILRKPNKKHIEDLPGSRSSQIFPDLPRLLSIWKCSSNHQQHPVEMSQPSVTDVALRWPIPGASAWQIPETRHIPWEREETQLRQRLRNIWYIYIYKIYVYIYIYICIYI